MKEPLGRAYRAVVPYSPEPPFRVYAEAGPPLEIHRTAALAKRGEELTVLVDIKPRPILVITEPAAYGEVLALRLIRFSKLKAHEQQSVRDGEHPDLFHLKPEAFSGLSEEAAAMISTVTRLPVSAIDTGEPLGEVNENELRVIHERLVRLHKLDLRALVLQRAKALVEGLKGRSSKA